MIRSILRSGASAYAGSRSSQTLTRFTHRRLSSTGTNNAGSSSSSRNSKGEIANNNTTESKLVTSEVTLSQIGSVVADSFSTSFLRLITYGVIGVLGGTLVLNYEKKHKDKSDNLPMPSPSPSPSPPRSSYVYMKKLAQTDEDRFRRLLEIKGLNYSLYPRVSIASEGQKVITRFTIPAICNIPDLTGFIVSNLGLKVEDLRGSNIKRSYRKVDWLLTNERKQVQGEEDDTEEDLTVLIISHDDESEIAFIKGGSLTDKELLVLVDVLKLAGESTGKNATSKKPKTPVLQ